MLYFLFLSLSFLILSLKCGNIPIQQLSDYSFHQSIRKFQSLYQVDLAPLNGNTLPLYDILLRHNADIFSFSTSSATFLTTPTVLQSLSTELPPSLTFRTLIANVSDFLSTLPKPEESISTFNINSPSDWFQEYHPLEKIERFYADLEKHYPERVHFFNIGLSHEGREIMAVSFTMNPNCNTSQTQSQNNLCPRFYIQGGIHAREWISHATVQYLSYHLATSSDPMITFLLTHAEFVIVPVMNPDGYAYTWKRDRLWRKNRRPNDDHSFGVDLNRNFDANWGRQGTSKIPSSETYCGPSAASEPEVRAVTDFFSSLDNIVMALDLHSYSQLILRPIGWTHKDAPHEKHLKKVGKKIAKIIQNVHGKIYISEKSVSLYPTTGAAHDWFYMQKKNLNSDDQVKLIRPYAFTIELRPTAEWFGPGFLLDPSEIIPTGEEILPAILYLANHSLFEPLLEKQALISPHSLPWLLEVPLKATWLWFFPLFMFLLWSLSNHFKPKKSASQLEPILEDRKIKQKLLEIDSEQYHHSEDNEEMV